MPTAEPAAAHPVPDTRIVRPSVAGKSADRIDRYKLRQTIGESATGVTAWLPTQPSWFVFPKFCLSAPVALGFWWLKFRSEHLSIVRFKANGSPMMQ